MIREDEPLRPGLRPESWYIRMRLRRLAAAARVPRPEIELEGDELCSRCLTEVPAMQLCQGICSSCRGARFAAKGKKHIGKYQRRAMQALATHGPLTKRQIVELADVDPNTLEKGLVGLREKGCVLIDKDKLPCVYEITATGRERL